MQVTAGLELAATSGFEIPDEYFDQVIDAVEDFALEQDDWESFQGRCADGQGNALSLWAYNHQSNPLPSLKQCQEMCIAAGPTCQGFTYNQN